MDAFLATLPRPVRRSVRALLKALALALLPFARAADCASVALARRFPRLAAWQWHVAMALTAVAVSATVHTGIRWPKALWSPDEEDMLVLDLHIEITHGVASAAFGMLQAVIALHTAAAVLMSAALRMILAWPILSATCVVLASMSLT